MRRGISKSIRVAGRCDHASTDEMTVPIMNVTTPGSPPLELLVYDMRVEFRKRLGRQLDVILGHSIWVIPY